MVMKRTEKGMFYKTQGGYIIRPDLHHSYKLLSSSLDMRVRFNRYKNCKFGNHKVYFRF